MFHKDSVRINWYERRLEQSFAYYDKMLKAWFYIVYLPTGKEIEGCSFTSKTLAYKRMVANANKAGWTNLPPMETIEVFKNLTISYTKNIRV